MRYFLQASWLAERSAASSVDALNMEVLAARPLLIILASEAAWLYASKLATRSYAP